MMKLDQPLFEEKQYIGFNKFSIIWRTVLAIFCFTAYYWSENPKPVDVKGIHIVPYPIENIENSGELFFLMGIFILLLSAILIFVLHIHTRITEQSITIDGLWTSRKVKIDFSSIVSAQKVAYSKYLLNRAVYNLHQKGEIRFFTQGNDAIELTDREGLKYRIGTQKPNELLGVIQNQLEKKEV